MTPSAVAVATNCEAWQTASEDTVVGVEVIGGGNAVGTGMDAGTGDDVGTVDDTGIVGGSLCWGVEFADAFAEGLPGAVTAETNAAVPTRISRAMRVAHEITRPRGLQVLAIAPLEQSLTCHERRACRSHAVRPVCTGPSQGLGSPSRGSEGARSLGILVAPCIYPSRAGRVDPARTNPVATRPHSTMRRVRSGGG